MVVIDESPSTDCPSAADLGPTQALSLRVLGCGGGGGNGISKEMRDLEELFSKLNPMAEEFVPTSITDRSYYGENGGRITRVYFKGTRDFGGFARKVPFLFL